MLAINSTKNKNLANFLVQVHVIYKNDFDKTSSKKKQKLFVGKYKLAIDHIKDGKLVNSVNFPYFLTV